MILIAGATGYTGRFVVEALRTAGHDMRCLVRPGSDVAHLKDMGIDLITGDLAQPTGLSGALKGIDALISVAHIRFSQTLVSACAKAGVSRVVFFSSTWRFSKVKTQEVTAVADGERAVRTSDLPYTLLRPTMIYGPGDDRNISRLRAILRRWPIMPIFGSGERRVQPVYVADVAQAVVGALTCPEAIGKAYELAGPAPMPYADMIDILAQCQNRVVVKVHIPLFMGILMARIGRRLNPDFPLRTDQVRRMGEDRAFDISAAMRDLKFSPRSFEAGIREAMHIDHAQAEKAHP